ncbi:hypothetical protein Tco_0020779 [Tanacetum coccineum]
MKLSMKKVKILKKNTMFRGGLLGLKDFLILLELLLLLWKSLLLLDVKTVKILVTTAKHKLVIVILEKKSQTVRIKRLLNAVGVTAAFMEITIASGS